MRLGINLPYAHPNGSALSAAQVMARARLIEQIGFDAIWLGDTIGRTATARPDVLGWLLLATAGTERIELGTAILQLPLRNPVELAQRLMTLHAVSCGRFRAGLGAGSTRADYDAVGVEYERRFTLFAHDLDKVRRLIAGQRVGGADIHPFSDNGDGPPIYIGAWGSGLWVKRAARDYDGWMSSGRGTSMKGLEEGIKRFRDAGGKRAMVMTVTVDLHAPRRALGPDDSFSLVCGPQEATDRLHRLAELGYDDVGLVKLGHTQEDLPESELRAIRALLATHS
jgi:alkanesulfonate monooxygenase SsuD/methylene tetrahydromethanopterin reductase-like flavin-dependent oxidoreductase (luciferase family)